MERAWDPEPRVMHRATFRRAHLTIMENGASLSAWPRVEAAQIDDWVVMVQQADEASVLFTERVSERARRLAREGAEICAVDILTAGAEGLGQWLALLDEVGPRGSESEPATSSEAPRSGIHEKPGVAKAERRRVSKIAGVAP
jgi:hypothetical protein